MTERDEPYKHILDWCRAQQRHPLGIDEAVSDEELRAAMDRHMEWAKANPELNLAALRKVFGLNEAGEGDDQA